MRSDENDSALYEKKHGMKEKVRHIGENAILMLMVLFIAQLQNISGV